MEFFKKTLTVYNLVLMIVIIYSAYRFFFNYMANMVPFI